jgi:hypothetical protein
MADNVIEWDLISNDSELSDVYWPESEESDGEETDGHDSIVETEEKEKEFVNKPRRWHRDLVALVMADTESEGGNSDCEEEIEEKEKEEEEDEVAEENGLVESIVEGSEVSWPPGPDEYTQEEEEDVKEETEEEQATDDADEGDTETLVGSVPSPVATDNESNTAEDPSQYDILSDWTTWTTSKSAMQLLEEEVHETVKRCRTVIQPLIAQVHLLSLQENPFHDWIHFKRLERKYQPLTIDCSLPLETRTKIDELLNVLRQTRESIPITEQEQHLLDMGSSHQEASFQAQRETQGYYYGSCPKPGDCRCDQHDRQSHERYHTQRLQPQKRSDKSYERNHLERARGKYTPSTQHQSSNSWSGGGILSRAGFRNPPRHQPSTFRSTKTKAQPSHTKIYQQLPFPPEQPPLPNGVPKAYRGSVSEGYCATSPLSPDDHIPCSDYINGLRPDWMIPGAIPGYPWYEIKRHLDREYIGPRYEVRSKQNLW